MSLVKYFSPLVMVFLVGCGGSGGGDSSSQGDSSKIDLWEYFAYDKVENRNYTSTLFDVQSNSNYYDAQRNSVVEKIEGAYLVTVYDSGAENENRFEVDESHIYMDFGDKDIYGNYERKGVYQRYVDINETVTFYDQEEPEPHADFLQRQVMQMRVSSHENNHTLNDIVGTFDDVIYIEYFIKGYGKNGELTIDDYQVEVFAKDVGLIGTIDRMCLFLLDEDGIYIDDYADSKECVSEYRYTSFLIDHY